MLKYTEISNVNQLPLIHIINEDDQLLSNSPDAQWYQILKDMPWEQHQNLASDYYNALYDFNKSRQLAKTDKAENNDETKDEGRQRLLFDRATIDKSKPALHLVVPKNSEIRITSPESVAPGIVPERLGGKKPKCFFALFKSFLAASLMGFPPEPEIVYNLLSSNLSLARVCGFVPNNNDEYWFKSVPSLRKLEQFDQIMTEYGLWNQTKWDEIRRNISEGVIKPENTLVGDTTHYHAYSGFETVKYVDDKGEEKKKSQSKVTKNCRCEDQNNCPHPWELADDGAGTIVKSNNQMHWGHKAAILGLPQQGIPLDAMAVADASTHDSETLLPHIQTLFNYLPEVEPWIDTVLYDSACYEEKLRGNLMDLFGIELKTSVNPRRKKTITENLPEGMAKLTPFGNLICSAGFEMDYKGTRFDFEKFIYQAPLNEHSQSVCETCPHKATCSPRSTKGRVVTISFDNLPSINPNDPPMAKRFKAIMTLRPSVERMIKRLKCDLSDDQLRKRGNDSFQAYLDKSMIAFHILLRN